MILEQCGISAVGAPGAETWKRHHARLFYGFAKVYIFGDGDKAGQNFSKKVYDSLSNGTIVPMPSNTDVNDLFLAQGRSGILNLIEEK